MMVTMKSTKMVRPMAMVAPNLPKSRYDPGPLGPARTRHPAPLLKEETLGCADRAASGACGWNPHLRFLPGRPAVRPRPAPTSVHPPASSTRSWSTAGHRGLSQKLRVDETDQVRPREPAGPAGGGVGAHSPRARAASALQAQSGQGCPGRTPGLPGGKTKSSPRPPAGPVESRDLPGSSWTGGSPHGPAGPPAQSRGQRDRPFTAPRAPAPAGRGPAGGAFPPRGPHRPSLPASSQALG